MELLQIWGKPLLLDIRMNPVASMIPNRRMWNGMLSEAQIPDTYLFAHSSLLHDLWPTTVCFCSPWLPGFLFFLQLEKKLRPVPCQGDMSKCSRSQCKRQYRWGRNGGFLPGAYAAVTLATKWAHLWESKWASRLTAHCMYRGVCRWWVHYFSGCLVGRCSKEGKQMLLVSNGNSYERLRYIRA